MVQEDEATSMSICEDIQKHWAEETARRQEGMWAMGAWEGTTGRCVGYGGQCMGMVASGCVGREGRVCGHVG